jgi:hypothetical protein
MAHLLQHLFEDYDNEFYTDNIPSEPLQEQQLEPLQEQQLEPLQEQQLEPLQEQQLEPLQEHQTKHQLEPLIDIKQLDLEIFSKRELSLPPQEWKEYIDSSPIQLIIKTKNKYNSFYKKIMKLRRKTLNAKYARKLRVKEGTIKQQFKELTKENKKLKAIIKHLLLKT